MIRYTLLLFTGLFVLTGCLEKSIQDTHNRALLLNEHPLAGKIWDVNQSRFIQQDQLFAQLIKSQYLLLGETHDNISHHQHQAQIISKLAGSSTEASVHFEMIDNLQYEAQKLAQIGSFQSLMKRLIATETGWNYEQMYRMVFEQVIEADYSIYPANLNHDTVQKIIQQGEEVIPKQVRALMDEVPLSADQLAFLKQEVIEGHCNALPMKMVAPVILVQRARDATMSLSMLQSENSRRVLIAGSGHVRKDRAVPLYLAAKEPQAGIVTLGFLEVQENAKTVEQYQQRWEGEVLPFDYVWFTPRYDRVDPCLEFIKMMQQSAHKKAADQKQKY